METKLMTRALGNAFVTACYVALVALLMSSGERIFGKNENFLVPLAMLLLFVLSASITGGLVLGKPILLYLENKRQEAVKLFLYTLVSLAVILISVLAVAALV